MKRNLLKSILNNSLRLLVLGLVFLCSCEYEPTETKLTQVNDPVAPEAYLYLSMNSDTINIARSAKLDFSFLCENHQIYEFTVQIDDSTIYTLAGQDTLSRVISIKYGSLTEGIHLLTMKAVVDTKSGSLADKVKSEAFTLTKTWIINYIKDPVVILPPIVTPHFTFAGLVDGTLKLEWEEMNPELFTYYFIKRGVYNETTQKFTYYSFHQINHYDINYTEDKEFLGGKIRYVLYYCVNGNVFSPTDTIEFSGRTIQFNVATDSKLHRAFSWNKTELTNNFGKVTISYSDSTDNYSTLYTLKEFSDPNDTIYNTDDGFYPKRRYYFTMSPNSGSGESSVLAIKRQKDYVLKESFLPAGTFAFADVNPYNIYCASSDVLYKYSTATNTIESVTVQAEDGLQVSLNNQYLYGGKYIINPLTLEFQELNIKGEMGFTTPYFVTSISDNGVFAGVTNSYAEKVAYDLINKKPIQTISSPNSIYRPRISPNGEYIVLFGLTPTRFEIWKYNADSSKYIEQFVQNGEYNRETKLLFVQDNTESKFYILNGSALELWSCELNTLLESHYLDISNLIQIDPVTKNLVAYSDGYIKVYNTDNYSLLWQVGIDPHLTEQLFDFINKQIVVVNSVIYIKNQKIDLKNYETVQ
jgi:hypothetical protein